MWKAPSGSLAHMDLLLQLPSSLRGLPACQVGDTTSPSCYCSARQMYELGLSVVIIDTACPGHEEIGHFS